MRADVKKCLRNWRWWVALPVMAIIVATIKAADRISNILCHAAAPVWRWVHGGGA